MYFVMTTEEPDDGYLATLEYAPDNLMRDWMSGARFRSPPPEPIEVQARMRAKSRMAEMWEVPIAIASLRLLGALRSAGVANLDTYEVRLTDSKSGEVHENYRAFNIVGKAAVADSAKTVFTHGSTDRLIAADIDSLAIDTTAASGLMMFRLAETVSAIVVHESVRRAIEASGIETVSFIKPEDWMG